MVPCALSFAVILVGFEVFPTHWFISLPATQLEIFYLVERTKIKKFKNKVFSWKRCLNFLDIFSSSPGLKIDISYPLQLQFGLRLQGQAPWHSIVTSLSLVKHLNSHLLKYVVPSDPQSSGPHTLKYCDYIRTRAANGPSFHNLGEGP